MIYFYFLTLISFKILLNHLSVNPDLKGIGISFILSVGLMVYRRSRSFSYKKTLFDVYKFYYSGCIFFLHNTKTCLLEMCYVHSYGGMLHAGTNL